MKNHDTTNEQLINELETLRRRVAELEESEARLKRTQRLLRESEERFRLLYEYAPLGYQSLDENGFFLEVNQAWLDTLGYSREEVIGTWFGDFLAPGYQEHFKFNFPKFKAAGEIHWVEFEMVRKDGSQIFVAFDGQIGRDEQGRFRQTHCILHDISEVKRSQDALKESEEMYRSLVTAMTEGAIFQAADGRITAVNPAAERIEGRTAAQMIGRTSDDPQWGAVYEDGTPFPGESHPSMVTLRTGEPQFDVVMGIHRSDGTLVWISINSQPLILPGETKPYAVVTTFHDITERKRAEEALRESEEKYRTLFEESFDGLFITSPRGNILDMNKKGVEMFGYNTKEEIFSLDLEGDVYAHPPDRMRIHSMVDAQGSAEYDVVVKKKNGEHMITHCSLTAVRDEKGGIASYRGIIRDITERKLAEVLIRIRLDLLEYSATHSIKALLQKTLDEIGTLTNSPVGFYHFISEDEKTIYLQMWSDRTLKEFCSLEGKGKHYPVDQAGVWADAVRERRPLIHNDYSSLPHRKGMPEGHATVLRELVVPIMRSNRIVAVLGIRNKNTDYTNKDVEIVSYLADVAWEIVVRKQGQEALQAASVYNRSLIEASLDPLVTISLEGKITDVNTAAEKVTGYSREDLVGTDFADYFTDPEKARAGYQEAFKVGSVRDYELEILHKKGGLTPVMYNASVYHDHSGKLTGLFAAARNITKQKTAEQALQRSEEQYRAVFHNAGIGLKVVNRDRRIGRANPALLKMFGYSEEELLELTPEYVTHPDDRDITSQYLGAILGDGPDSLRLVKRYLRKDGSVIWGDVSISAMRDAQGNRIAALEVVADITDRTKSQIALQESEKRLRRIIDSSPVGIRITQDGRHVYANRALARMFGYESQEEILGLSAEALFAPESRALIRRRVADRIADKPIPPHYEASGITRHGKTIALESWGTEIDYLGKKSWLAFIIDVSEAKSLRAQLIQAQKMEAIGTLAGGIAHDFNNVLQVVLGFSEILLMGKQKGDSEYEDLEKILSAARKGADLVGGLLAFSRKAEINPKPLNLNQVIHQAEAILARTIPKTIKIDLVLQERLSAINADPFQIEQILLNLAINARDAMPGGGALTFETSSVSLDETYCGKQFGVKAGDYVLLTVSDTGAGMTKQTLEHIFEPFFSTKPVGEGTGLGLAMVYGIVKQHSGHIMCYSEPGVGTSFKVYFPIIEMKDETSVREEVVRFPGGTETVLLVDDEDLVRELANRILSRAGYTVLAATNGREALQVYKKERKRISLVLLDLIMPEMDGKQCLKELLKLDPGARVVVASGYSAEGITKQALEGRARGFVSKPFDMGQLLQTIRKALDET